MQPSLYETSARLGKMPDYFPREELEVRNRKAYELIVKISFY